MRSATGAFLEQVIEHLYLRSPSVRTQLTSLLPDHITYIDRREGRGEDLNGLRAAVYQELRLHPFWRSLQQNILALADMESASPTADPEIVPQDAGVPIGDDRATLGRRLDRYRRDCGWAITVLASKLEMEESTVKEHLNDKARPRPQTLRKYVDLFNAELKLSPPIRVSDLEGEVHR